MIERLQTILSTLVTFFFPPDEGNRDRMLSWAELLPVVAILVLMILVVWSFCR